MKKLELDALKGKTFEEGKSLLEEYGYVFSDAATDRQAPGCDYIEDTYFVLFDEDDEEADRISFARHMNRNNDPANDDGTNDFTVKERWEHA